MFEKTLTDFIRGLRTNKYSQDYILKCQHEIQVEIATQATRKNALKKLLILYLLGIDITWAAFHIIQAISIREEKRAGYLIASLAFNQNSPVLIMATNVIKKDLVSTDVKDVLLSLHTLAQITSHDLSRDLHFDVSNLLSHSNASVRKRAILVLFRMFKKYPGCWESCFSRLQTKLHDSDPSVVSCCVTVICELGKEEPEKYLALAPQLFDLLVSSSNNWMLIKMVKLFASLTPHEPRLAKKLVEPLRKLIEHSKAISVVYECVYACIRGDMLVGQDDELCQLCFKKLEYFLSHPDQNIRFLGLFALSKLAVKMPSVVAIHHQIVLKCMDDPDLSIRSQSLHLISSIVNEDTLYEITKKLMLHLSTENENSASFTSEIIEYRSLVASVIINSCTKDSYQYLGDFEWFIDVLSDVCKFNGLNLGKLASDELINVCVRVSDVRGYALRKSRELVFNSLLLHDGTEGCGILVAAAWITGEYATVDTIDLDLLESFLSQDVFGLSPEAQSAYLYAFFKLFIKFKKKHENVNVSIFTSLLDRFVNSTNFEIQERALFIKGLIMDSLTTAESIWSSTELFGIFANEVQPISDTAQSRVLIPDGLDLETWLCPMDPKDFTLPTYTGFYPRIEKQASIPQFENEENTTLKDSNLNDRSALKNETETTHELQSIIRKPQSKKYDLKQNFEDGLQLNEIKSTTIEPISISEVKKEPKKTHHKKSHKRTSSELHEKLQIHISGKKYKIWSQDGIFLQISWSEQPQSFMQQTKARIDIYMSLVNSEGAPLSFTLDPARKESTMKIRQFDDKYKVLQLKLERPNIESLFSRNIQLKLGLEESTFNVEFHIPFEMNFLLPNQAELATMTPPKFMKILQNPPLGYFSAVGTSNIVAPDNLQLEQVCNLLATSINCIIVERHPAASSLYGLLCNGIPIVGLVKERQNAKGKKLLSIEIKTGDSKVLEWVNEMVSNFASELI